MPVPLKEKLLEYVKRHAGSSKKRTYSAMAKHFDTHPAVISALANDLKNEKKVMIEQTGSAKVVQAVKGA